MPIQGSFDAVDQDGPREGLGQEANGAGLQRPGADTFVGESRDKDKRRIAPLGAHMHQKVQAAHNGHLHIRNDARQVVQVGRLQELLGRRKRTDRVSMRAEQIVGRGADGCVVVNNRNNRSCWQRLAFLTVVQGACRSTAARSKNAPSIEVAKSYIGLCAYDLLRRTPRISAFLTKSANDLAPIFFMMCPRWIFTVISASPSSAATCLFMRPDETKAKTSRSRGVRVSSRVCKLPTIWSASRRFRSRSIAITAASSMSWSRNGLVRKSTAPLFMALTVIGMSPWPVMKMIGI